MNFERKSSVTTMGEQDQSPGSCGDDGHSKGQILENPSQKKMKIETECEETGIDWISELPDSLIVQILSQMPITDAFKTTFLSKRWLNLWTSIDNLIFDNRKTYWSDSLISKIDKWLEIALKKKVEDLDLEIWYYDREPYVLPQVLCSSSSMLKMNCQFCRIPEECVLNWTSLKSLTLTDLFLRDEHVEQIITNCPQLESLKLCDFCGFHCLHITSPKCRSLQLIDHAHPAGDWGSFGGDCSFEIVAPYIQHLKISGPFDRVEVRLGNLSSLVHADLTFSVDAVFDKTVELHLASVRCANELMVPCWFIEMIYLVLEKKNVSLLLLECKRLTINSWISKSSILGIGGLLRSTPYLENLTIFHQEVDFLAWDEDFDLSGDDSLSMHENIFEGSLKNLKNAEVTSKCCSCFHSADTTELLTELLNSLLEHAKIL